MYLVINKCVTAVKVSNFSGHYLRNRPTLDTGVLGYICIVQHKEHSPEVLSISPGTACILPDVIWRSNIEAGRTWWFLWCPLLKMLIYGVDMIFRLLKYDKGHGGLRVMNLEIV